MRRNDIRGDKKNAGMNGDRVARTNGKAIAGTSERIPFSRNKTYIKHEVAFWPGGLAAKFCLRVSRLSFWFSVIFFVSDSL